MLPEYVCHTAVHFLNILPKVLITHDIEEKSVD